MNLIELGREISTPEFDYNFLLSIVGRYKAPRDAITRLLRQQAVIRVKKGIYVLGPIYERPFSPHVLANLIYGPSYVSGHAALAYYGLIPERVETLSSTTPNRRKEFRTPIGTFIYNYLPMHLYRTSVTLQGLGTNRAFLLASREKAILETMLQEADIATMGDVRDWLDAMRIDIRDLKELRKSEIRRLAKLFDFPAFAHLSHIKDIR
ncbi:MAG: hypothetical protein FJ146_08775 [Deltaproteobacteria bacterium]|nr:hypothetical protein [Deltaproteobacteria bacterium]